MMKSLLVNNHQQLFAQYYGDEDEDEAVVYYGAVAGGGKSETLYYSHPFINGDTPMNIDRDIAEKVMGWTNDLNKYPLYEFNPSTNIYDAFIVVEKLHQEKIYLTLDGHEQGYDAEFSSYRELDPDPISGEAREDTAPLAICKSALAVIGETDNVE